MRANGPLYDFPVPTWRSTFYLWPLFSSEASAKRMTLRFVRVSTLLPLAFLATVFGFLPLLRAVLDFSLHNFPLVADQSMITIGVLLYAMRCRKQLMYGVTECLVGVMAAVYVANNLKPEDPSQWFSFLAGLYIIVRGADNIQKSLKGTKYEVLWNRIFFGKDASPS
jgi:hypothetical protein